MNRRRRLTVGLAIVILAGTGCDSRMTPGESPPLLLFGRTGMGAVEFNYPRAAAVDARGILYVVDKAGRVQALSQAGEFALDWRMPEIEIGKPTGLGFGPDGNLYVADTHYSRIMIFAPDGRRLGEFGSPGDGPGQFGLPTDIAFDHEGFIYISEYGGNDRISRFSPDREYLFSFGGPDAGSASLQRPQTLLVAPDNTLWVTDACNHRVCHFDGEGHLLGSIGRPGHEVGELWFPYGIDMLSDGTLVVCEFGNNRVQRFDPAGKSLGTWGAAGRQPGQLAYPWAVAVGAADRVFIVDSGNNRVQVIAGTARRTWHQPDK